MSWSQLVVILLTGLLAILASAVGQFVGGLMAEKRARADREIADRERFTQDKRDLYLKALGLVTRSEKASFDDRTGMMLSLALFEPEVSAKFTTAANAHSKAWGRIADKSDEVREALVTEVLSGRLGMEQAKPEAFKRAQEFMRAEGFDGPEWNALHAALVDLGNAMTKSLGIKGKASLASIGFDVPDSPESSPSK